MTSILLLLACTAEPEPEPAPAPVVVEPEPEPVVWHTERDPVGLWSAEVPADMQRTTKLRRFDPKDEEATEYEWIEMSGRSYGALKAQADVGWLPLPEGLEDPMASLVSMARVPETAEQRALAGMPARFWTTEGALGHWSNAVFATETRLYYLRFTDSEDDRATDAHARFFDSFVLLADDELSEDERAAVTAWRAERDAEAAAANAEPLTPAQIEANRALVKAIVLEQVGMLSCLIDTNADRSAIVKLSVNRGKLSSIRVYHSSFSINGPGKPTTERTDLLATCLRAEARSWQFPETLTASNVEVPFSFW